MIKAAVGEVWDLCIESLHGVKMYLNIIFAVILFTLSL